MRRRGEDWAAAARRIGDGDLAARVRPAPEIEEMDVLARAFNTMAEGLSRDIMRREKAEEALRASEQRHKIIIENSPLGMIFYDSDGKIVDCNRLFVDMMGSSRERIIGFNTALHGGSPCCAKNSPRPWPARRPSSRTSTPPSPAG